MTSSATEPPPNNKNAAWRPPLTPSAPPSLPPGWSQYETENGTSYYHHEEFGTQWDRPNKSASSTSSSRTNNNNRRTDQTGGQPSAATGGLFGYEEGKYFNLGDDFFSSISSMWGDSARNGNNNDKNAPATIEGNLRGDCTPPKRGFFSRILSLQPYFQLTSDEYFIRATSVFTILQGFLSGRNGSTGHLVKANMYLEKPDFFGLVWLTVLGATLLGFLPNLCRYVSGGQTDYHDFNDALFILSLFPSGAVLSNCGGYFAQHHQSARNPAANDLMQLQAPGSSNTSSEDAPISLPGTLCLSGYMPIPLILIIPFCMFDSWFFRLIFLTLAYLATVGFLLLVIRGSNESILACSTPRKVQYFILGLMTLLAYMCVMLKLPSWPQKLSDSRIELSLAAQEDILKNLNLDERNLKKLRPYIDAEIKQALKSGNTASDDALAKSGGEEISQDGDDDEEGDDDRVAVSK